MHAKTLLLSWLMANIAIVIGNDNQIDEIQPPLKVPQPFNESVLPPAQRSGEVIAGLGKVMKIDTFSASMFMLTRPSREELETTFGLHQGGPTPADCLLVFQAGNYCKLGSTDAAEPHGPYEYDLDQLLALNLDGGNRQQFMIVIPGYRTRREDEWTLEIRKKWLELNGDAGGIAIEVHWDELASTTVYDRAVANTAVVARQVTILLHYLAELSGTHLMDPDFLARIHIVGHSLGAHMAGFIGKDLESKLGRITALDPAGPSFDKLPSHQRLHQTDARLVEVLHTNSGRMRYMNLAASAALAAMGMVPFTDGIRQSVNTRYTGEGDTAWFGMDAQLGHIEYYANNGRIQPGCEGLLHICDHKRACGIYVDILAYMASVKRSKSTAELFEVIESVEGPERARQLAEVNRLRAFKSQDYESFAAGHSFLQHCPELMDIETHLNDTVIQQVFDQCSVPLFDLTKPLEEVIDELKTKHGIDFDGDSGASGGSSSGSNTSDEAGIESSDSDDPAKDNGQLEPRAVLRIRPSFYFKTTPSEGDLVGDHFLLKIYLTKPISWNEAHCSLEAQIIMPDGDRINLELKRLLHPAANQTVLAMPFVYHRNSEAKDQFNELMRIVKLIECPHDLGEPAAIEVKKRSNEFGRVFSKLFPEKIRLKLARPKVSGIFRSVYDIAKQMIKSDDEVSSVCQLTTDMIEVHPLIYGLEKNFGALYGRDLLLSGDTLQVINTSEQLRRRRDPSKCETTLSADAINCLTFGLESAVASYNGISHHQANERAMNQSAPDAGVTE